MGALGVREACSAAGLAPEQQSAWARAFRRSALRAFDEGLKRTLALQARALGDGLGASELRGSVSELSVTDLLQTLALGRRDGVIAIRHDGVESRLWVIAGEVVDAESGGLAGEAAVYRVLALDHGQLSAELYAVQRARSVQRSTAALLLEAARRTDEIRLLRGRFARQRFVLSSMASEPGGDATEGALLAALHGPLDAAQLRSACGLEEFEALTALAALVDKQRIVATSEPPVMSPAARLPSSPTLDEPAPQQPALQQPAPQQPAPQRRRPRWERRLLAVALVSSGVLAAWRWPRPDADGNAPIRAEREPTVTLAARPQVPAPSGVLAPNAPAVETTATTAAAATSAQTTTTVASSAPVRAAASVAPRPPRPARATTSPPDDREPRMSPTERASEPRVPRMRIIEEQIPQMQIVE